MTPVAQELALMANRAGQNSTFVVVPDIPPEKVPELDGVATVYLSQKDAGSIEALRSILHRFNGFTTVLGAGVLDSPSTLLVSGAVDGVLMVVQRGRTMRDDVERARHQVETAGGTVVGSVLAR